MTIPMFEKAKAESRPFEPMGTPDALPTRLIKLQSTRAKPRRKWAT